MNLIKSNIIEMWREKPSFFIVVILVQMLASFSVLYATGAIANDYYSIKEDYGMNLTLYVPFLNSSENGPVCYSMIEETVSDIFNGKMSDTIKGAYIFTDWIEGAGENGTSVRFDSSFKIVGDRYFLPDITKEGIEGTLIEGHAFTDEEMNSKGYYVIIGGAADKEIELNGKKFEIVGKTLTMLSGTDSFTYSTTPYAVKSLNLKLGGFSFELKRMIREDELEYIKEKFERVLPGQCKFIVQTSSDEDKKAIMKSSLVISALIGMSALAVLAVIYGYIIGRRNRNLAIWRLTGCSSVKAAGFFFTEMAAISVPSVLLGFAVFRFVQVKWLNGLFPYMSVTYTFSLYAGLYLAIMSVLAVLFMGISIFNSRYSVKQQLIRAEI